MTVTPAQPVEGPRPRRTWQRRLVRLAVLLALGYVGVIVVLALLENWMLFHPVCAAEDWQAPPADIRAEEVELRLPDQTLIHAWWCPTRDWEPDRGAVLYCHGNAGNLSHRGESIRRWQEVMKQAVLIFDYPGYGKSEGRPSEAGCYASAIAAHDWLVRERKVPPDRILLYGGSLGCAVAVDLASQRPHRAVVLVSAFTSIPDMAQQQFPWLPARWLVRNRFDNLTKIGRCTRPVFIAHGTADRLVPFQQGQRLFAAANEPKQFFPMDGYDHNHTPGPDFYTALDRFLSANAGLTPN